MPDVRVRPVVVADNVSVLYGREVALGSSSFEIPAAAITAVIGPNGSGKSTLLNLVAGLVKPASGSLEVSGGGDRRRISYVMQSTKVNEALPISVREVVAMGRYAGLGPYRWFTPADQAAVDRAMARTGVTDLGSRHLHELSGGQRQRALVAQGLAQDHDLLLLDEPLTGLDITSAQAIDDVIHQEQSEGCAIVLTTHDLAEAEVADHVILLSGRVVASGPPTEALRPENLIEAYGPSLLHVQGRKMFIDDPAHAPSASRHVHRDRGSESAG